MAQTRSGIIFGPYRLDVAGARLWKGTETVSLQPRPLAVLAYLAAQPGAVVGREELLAKLWAGTHVTKAVLKVAVRAIREALDDDADAPSYIETVGHEGYRFIGGGVASAPVLARSAAAAEIPMVGRERDLTRLHTALEQAREGTRAIVLVSGEPGIGKSTLLDRFLGEVDPTPDICIARGQCLEQYGEGEAYLPILEALGALAREEARGDLSATLAQHAPTWVSQLAALAPNPLVPWRRDGAIAPTPARMLREMADALEVFTEDRTLILVLEDLQWSDPSSVDLISCIARRRQPARLLVVGSLRTEHASTGEHALAGVQHELLAKGLCEEIELALLSQEEVETYLQTRFTGAPPAKLRWLARRVHERTEGNALFMVHMVNDLVAGGLLAWRDEQWHLDGSIETATERIPSGVQELISRVMHGLAPTDRQVLEAASVAGAEFAVAAVAAALEADPEAIEDACEQLAAQGALIVDTGVAEWPDGSVSGRYRFRHALYRLVLYEGIAEARRVRFHRAIGQREEIGFGARRGEHAAELAMHFARGRAHARALEFHELAAAAALERHAPHEAVSHCTAALEALAQMPDDPARAHRELSLVVARATLLMAIQGYGAPATEEAFARARALCESLPVGPQLYAVLRGLLSFHQVRGELRAAHDLGEQLLRLAAERPDDAVLRVQAHYGHGTTLFHMGEFEAARLHLEAALRDYEPAQHQEHTRVYGGYDPGVACSFWLAWTLVVQGELEDAASRDRAGFELAQRLGEVFSLAWAHYGASVSHQLMGRWPASEKAAAEAARMAEEHGFPHVLAMAMVNRGWAMVMLGSSAEGIALVRDGVALADRTGAALLRPSYIRMLAAADVLEGNPRGALARFDDALAEVERSGEHMHESRLLMAKSQLLSRGEGGRLSRSAAKEAEACLRKALDVARAQGARAIELRAAVALARHCQARGRAGEGAALLAPAYAWFAKRRPDAPESVAAGRLLAELKS